MATIISSRLDVDHKSYDYRVKLNDGREHVFHSQGGRPDDESAWVNTVEAELLAAEAAAAVEAAKPSELEVLKAENTALKAEVDRLTADAEKVK